MPDSQSREPEFESLLLPFQSLGIFVLSTVPQFIQYSMTDNWLWVVVKMCERLSLCAIIAAWSDAFQNASEWTGIFLLVQLNSTSFDLCDSTQLSFLLDGSFDPCSLIQW